MGNNIGLFSFFGIVLGVLFGPYLRLFQYLPIPSLLFVLTVASLATSPKEILQEFAKPKQIIWLMAFKLIVFPLLTYYFAVTFLPEYILPLMLLSLAPAGMSIPALAMSIKGNVRLAFAIAIVTSMLAPFFIPLALRISLGSTIEFDLLSMFRFLAFIIFVPFILSALIKKFSPKMALSLSSHSGAIAAISLMALNIGVIIPQREMLLGNWDLVGKFVLLTVTYSVVMHIIGMLINYWGSRENRITSILMMAYFNIGIMILISSQYFDAQTTLIMLIFELSFALGFIPVQKFFSRTIKQ